MEATDCSKKATDVVHQQIHLFGNDWCKNTLSRKRTKKVDVEEFNRYFQNLWNIQRWLEASDSEVEILNEPYEFYVVDNA